MVQKGEVLPANRMQQAVADFLSDRPIMKQHNVGVNSLTALLAEEVREFVMTITVPDGFKDKRQEKLQELSDILFFSLTYLQFLQAPLPSSLKQVTEHVQGKNDVNKELYMHPLPEHILSILAGPIAALQAQMRMVQSMVAGYERFEELLPEVELYPETIAAIQRIIELTLRLFALFEADVYEEFMTKVARNQIKYPAINFQTGDYGEAAALSSRQWEERGGNKTFWE